MKKELAFILLPFLLLVNVVYSQSAVKASNDGDAYTKTINERARKIVNTLAIDDSMKAQRVQALIASHYNNLNVIHTNRDAQKEKEKVKEKAARDASIKQIEEEASVAIKALHAKFLSALSSELTNEQVVKVKDGLTYNVVNITYAGYLDMLPNLTGEQKKQIKSWLEEARESAMDAETSEKKHGWFGKYKGRINNYLSTAGYDLKKEGEAWQKRIKEREEEKKNAAKN